MIYDVTDLATTAWSAKQREPDIEKDSAAKLLCPVATAWPLRFLIPISTLVGDNKSRQRRRPRMPRLISSREHFPNISQSVIIVSQAER